MGVCISYLSMPSARFRVWYMVRTSKYLLNGKIHEWLNALPPDGSGKKKGESCPREAHLSRMGRAEDSTGSKQVWIHRWRTWVRNKYS